MWTKRSHMRCVALAFLVALLLMGGCAQEAVPAKSELTFCPPLLRTSQFGKMRGPAQQLADYVSRESGVKVGVFVPTDYGNTILGLKNGEYDIAYIPAGLFPKVEAEAGVTPLFLVTVDGKAKEDSAIYVKSGSAVQSLADLRGKLVAAADPFSAAGWLVPAAELKKAGIDPISDISVNFRAVSADSIVEVLNDKADAAIAPTSALDDDKVAEAGGAGQLRVLQEFKDVPIGVIVFGKTVTRSQATKLKKAFSGIEKSGVTGTNSDGDSVPLLGVLGWDGLKAAKSSDFKDLRERAQIIGMIPAK